MRKTKNNSAYDQLKDLILREEFELGKMISTSIIADMIGMGRAPVTDAVKKLASEELLTIIPRQGIIIKGMTVQEMRDINETRLVLEPYIMEQIAQNFSLHDVEEINRFISLMKRHEAEEDYYNFIIADHNMHTYLYELYPNTCMVDILKKLRDRIFTVGFKIIIRREGRMKSTIQEHEAVKFALERRDSFEAAENMRKHLTNGWHLI